MDEIKALLHKFDEKDDYESPSNFAADNLERKARRVFEVLQNQLFKELIPGDIMHLCQQELQKKRFIFIPVNYLEEAYDGVMQATGVFRDRGIRYFDYL